MNRAEAKEFLIELSAHTDANARADFVIDLWDEAFREGSIDHQEECLHFCPANELEEARDISEELGWLRTRIERGEKIDALRLVDEIERAL